MLRTSSYYVSLVLTLLLIGQPHVARAASADSPSAREVSLLALIANPDEFHGQKVQTMGFITNGYSEDVALYVDREAFISRMTFNALWVDFRVPFHAPEVRKHDRQYVRVEGIFRKGDRGAFGFYSGSLNAAQIVSSFPREADTVGTTPRRLPSLGWANALALFSLFLSTVALGLAWRNRIR